MKKKLLLLAVMLYSISVLSNASLSVSLGNSTLQSGTTYTFPDLTVSGTGNGYVIRFMFTRSTTTNDIITLPSLPPGWSENSNSTQFVRMIDITSGASTTDLQNFLRQVQITFDSAKKGHGIMVLISEDSNDAGRNMYYNAANEHWYEFVKESKEGAKAGYPSGVPYEWWEAYNHALDSEFMGLTGYLATITTDAENEFIWTVSSGKMGWIGGTRGDIRGVMDTDNKHLTGRPSYSTCSDQSLFLGYWYWASGPEYDATRSVSVPQGDPSKAIFYNKIKYNDASTSGNVTFNYSAWGANQPDNAVNSSSCYENSAQGENYLHLGLGGGKGWNDYGVYGYSPSGPAAGNTIIGMVVEYEGTMTGVKSEGIVGFDSKKTSSIASGTKSSPAQLVYGDVVTYAIVASNASASNTAVTVLDTLPVGMIPSNISDGGSYSSSTHVITWNLTVATESEKTITYNATPDAEVCIAAGGPDFFNTATVISDGSLKRRTQTTYHRGKAATVSFAADANGHVINGTAQTVDYGANALSGVTTTANTGYKFKDWSYPNYTDLKGITKTASSNTSYTAIPIYGDVNLTANFIPITYNIGYTLNGGIHSSTPATYNYTQNVSINPPTKTGYTFSGWTITNDSASSPSITPPSDIINNPMTFGPGTVYGNLSLTAGWNENGYTIAYSIPTNASHSKTPVSYNFTDLVTIANPTMPGYTFLGWTITNDSTSSPIITPNINVSFGPSSVFGNLTFTAATPPGSGGGNSNWSQITYNISYNLNGGSHGTNHPNAYTVTDNVTVDIPTKAGYTFAGWTITSDSVSSSIPSSGKPTTFGPGDNVYGNLSFTATWNTDQYMITYNAGATGATLNNPPVNNPTTYDITNTPISLDNGGAKRNGYKFDKWNIVSDSTSIIIPNGMTIPANTIGNLTCTALWLLNTYNITYTIPSGVTHSQTPSTYDVTQGVTVANPAMPGYTFLGWTITNDSVSSPAISPATNVNWNINTVFGNLNFAVALPPSGGGNNINWSENIYNITYNYTGGTAPATANPTTYTVTTANIMLNDPSRAGYTFSGWTFVSDSASISIPPGKTIPKGTVGNLTCTAVWSAITYNITYNYSDDLSDPSTTPANPLTYNMGNLPVNINIAPARNYWTFTGWTGANGVVPETSVTVTSTSLGVPGHLAYMANWTKKKYMVTYNLNGSAGTAPTDSSSPYEWGLPVTTLDTLTGTSKANAVFVGWTTTQYFGNITDPSDTIGFGSKNPGVIFNMPTQHVTLYAVWATDNNGPDGVPDGIPDYMQIQLIYNENTRPGSHSISGTLPPITMHTKNTSAIVSGNVGNLERNPADSLILIGWSPTITNNKDVEIAADKPFDLILSGTVIPVVGSDINLYAIWAYDRNGNGIADCDEPNTIITPEHKWAETEDPADPLKPDWNPEYDNANRTSWYAGCYMTFTMTINPDPHSERTVNINYLGALKNGFLIDENGGLLKDSYTLAQNDSVFTLRFSIVEDSITSLNEGLSGAIETVITGGGRDTSIWFDLYGHPSYDLILVKPYIDKNNRIDLGLTGGSPNLMRSINGYSWQNAYAPLTKNERESVYDGMSIWLREPNGCWEAEFFFVTYIDPIIERYVELPLVQNVITTPGTGTHYVEGHQDFSFTASYSGGSPLKVMATGRYSGTSKELIGQDLETGIYQYTIRQVVEPWVITIGPDFASFVTGEDAINGLSVWAFGNTLYIRSDINTTVYIYNMRGVMCKRINVTEGITSEIMERGIYVVVTGNTRHKIIIK